MNRCPQCGAEINPAANFCQFCGHKFDADGSYAWGEQSPPPYGQPPYPPQYGQGGYPPGPRPGYRNINKLAAGLLAILLGGIGVHKFYMGRIGMGILYLLFCWTGIPAILGLIEGIIYLTMDESSFMEKYAKFDLKKYSNPNIRL